MPFAAFAQRKKRADALSVRFLRAVHWISHLQRMSPIRPFHRSSNLAVPILERFNCPFALIEPLVW